MSVSKRIKTLCLHDDGAVTARWSCAGPPTGGQRQTRTGAEVGECQGESLTGSQLRTTLPFRSVNSRMMRLSPVPSTRRPKSAHATPAGRSIEVGSAAETGTGVPTARAKATATRPPRTPDVWLGLGVRTYAPPGARAACRCRSYRLRPVPEHRPDHERADSVGARAGSQRAVPAWPEWAAVRCGRPFKAPRPLRRTVARVVLVDPPCRARRNQRDHHRHQVDSASLRTTCTSPPESTKPDPAGTTCGEQVGRRRDRTSPCRLDGHQAGTGVAAPAKGPTRHDRVLQHMCRSDAPLVLILAFQGPVLILVLIVSKRPTAMVLVVTPTGALPGPASRSVRCSPPERWRPRSQWSRRGRACDDAASLPFFLDVTYPQDRPSTRVREDKLKRPNLREK